MNTSTHSTREIMKPMAFLSGLLLMVLSTSCSTTRNGSIEPDDRYYSLADARKENRQLRKLGDEQPGANSGATVSSTDSYRQIPDNSTADYDAAGAGPGTTVNNNYYDVDDYYDYMYASRIRRFHRSWAPMGYYDPWFTNIYWYNYNPFFFGNSIYATYGFFNPYVPWGAGPGWNMGWNSFGGMYMNYNFGWGAWNNPWRWNYGYCSPFHYNPWGMNPYGFGMASWNNGFMNGYSMAMMQQNMISNQMYYNSFDHNTYNPPVTYAPNTGGVGSGASFRSSQPVSLNQKFSQELGQSATVARNAPAGGTLQNPNNTPAKSAASAAAASDAGAASQRGHVQGGNAGSVRNPSSVTPAGEARAASVQGNMQQGAGNTPSRAPSSSGRIESATSSVPVSGDVNTAGRYTAAPRLNSPSAVASQQGKEDLIRSGSVQPARQSNYSSAPVVTPERMAGNSPSQPVTRQPNLPATGANPGRTPVSSANQGNAMQQPARVQQYTPQYDYNSGILGNREPAQSQQPGTRQPDPQPGTLNQPRSNPANRQQSPEVQQRQGTLRQSPQVPQRQTQPQQQRGIENRQQQQPRPVDRPVRVQPNNPAPQRMEQQSPRMQQQPQPNRQSTPQAPRMNNGGINQGGSTPAPRMNSGGNSGGSNRTLSSPRR